MIDLVILICFVYIWNFQIAKLFN